MNRVKNEIAIVTGGGKNIGHAISLLLGAEGAKVIIIDIDARSGKETVNLIKKQGGASCFIKADVTNVNEVNHSINKVLDKFQRIDILINNVGKPHGITLNDIEEEIFYKNIDINLKSATFCTKAVLPSMIKHHKGSIIFISSINALLGGFSEVIYASAKGGLHSLVKILTADYSKFGIRFNVVCPGSIPGDSKVWKNREMTQPGMLNKLSEIYPLGRFGEPVDVAYATLFLASKEASWITGIVLPVDGGIIATGRFKGGKWWEKL